MSGPKQNEQSYDAETPGASGQQRYGGQGATEDLAGWAFKSATPGQHCEPGGFVYRSLAEHDGWERIDALHKAHDLTKTVPDAVGFVGATLTLKQAGRKCGDTTGAGLAARLIFDFKDYPVSQYYGFTSLEPVALLARVRDALRVMQVAFEPCEEEGKLLQCQAMSSSFSATFTINLLELKPDCQRTLGYKYVIEVCKGRCACPSMWRAICMALFAKLGDAVAKAKPKEELLAPDMPLPLSVDAHDGSCSEAKKEGTITTPMLEDSVELMDLFLDVVSSRNLPANCIEFAEAIANLYGRMRDSITVGKAGCEKLTSKELERLHSMLCHNEYDVRRCTCTILQTLLQNGMLTGLNAEEKEDLFKSLLRVVNMVGERCALLMPMQSEALLALKEMSDGFKPKGVLADQAKQTFDRCAMSENPRVSSNATVCLAQFFA